MAFVDKRLAEVCDIGENIFRNFTDRHMFIVGDKISYQIGNYEKEEHHYRIQGFVLAHGISTKGELMYLLSQMNTIVYDSENDVYCSDKRVTARWYTAREIHAEEGNKYCPKIIGYKTNRTAIRVCENHGIHFIDINYNVKKTKKTRTATLFQCNLDKNGKVFKSFTFNVKYYDHEKNPEIHKVVAAYFAPDQLAAATAYEKGDKEIVVVETIPSRWNEKQGKFIARKTLSKYYVLVDLTKKE